MKQVMIVRLLGWQSKTFRTENWLRFARRNQLGPALKNFKVCAARRCLYTGTPATSQSRDQGDEKHHQENEEQELCDSGRCHRYAAKAKNGSDDSDDQKYQRPIKNIAS